MKKGTKIDFSIFLYVICVLIVFVPFLSTYSRYTVETITEHYYNSKEFYFTSKSLTERVYNTYNWDGSSDYSFIIDVGNFKDELNWTKEDINYEYDLTCMKDDVPLNCSTDSDGVLRTDANNTTTNVDTVTIFKGDNTFNTGDTVVVNVTARSTSPYGKELSSTINVHVNNLGISYQVIDSANSLYLTLMIVNNSVAKDVDIRFDPTLISVDSTNNHVINGTVYRNESNFVNRLVLSTEIDHVYAIRFYKKDITANYNLSNNLFTIS